MTKLNATLSKMSVPISCMTIHIGIDHCPLPPAPAPLPLQPMGVFWANDTKYG